MVPSVERNAERLGDVVLQLPELEGDVLLQIGPCSKFFLHLQKIVSKTDFSVYLC